MALILQYMVQHVVQHMVYMGPCGNKGNKHQHRLQLQQDHKSRHASSSKLDPDITMTLGDSTGCQIDMGLAAAWPPDTNMAPSGSPDTEQLHGLL